MLSKICLQGICGQQRHRSDCADAQSDQGLRCPLPESLDAIECISGEQRPGGDIGHVQNNVNRHICTGLKAFFCLMWPTVPLTFQ